MVLPCCCLLDQPRLNIALNSAIGLECDVLGLVIADEYDVGVTGAVGEAGGFELLIMSEIEGYSLTFGQLNPHSLQLGQSP